MSSNSFSFWTRNLSNLGLFWCTEFGFLLRRINDTGLIILKFVLEHNCNHWFMSCSCLLASNVSAPFAALVQITLRMAFRVDARLFMLPGKLELCFIVFGLLLSDRSTLLSGKFTTNRLVDCSFCSSVGM